jgi:hypothetical protein
MRAYGSLSAGDIDRCRCLGMTWFSERLIYASGLTKPDATLSASHSTTLRSGRRRRVMRDEAQQVGDPHCILVNREMTLLNPKYKGLQSSEGYLVPYSREERICGPAKS